jgi:hypothetical protein
MGKKGGEWKGSPWRHTLGIVLLLVTVVLWTTSNFLASVSFFLLLIVRSGVRKMVEMGDISMERVGQPG